MSIAGWWGDKIIITLTSDGKRRHKTWCEHYCSEDGACRKNCSKCVGSATCQHYKSTIDEEEPIWTVKPSLPKEPTESEGRTPIKTEIFRLVSQTEKILGKTVMVRNTPHTFRIGEVVSEDFYFFSVEYGGKVHKYEKRTATRNRSVYVYEEEKCHFVYEEK